MSYKKYEEPQTDVEIHQKLDINYLVMEQIRRCNTAGSEGDEGKYSNCVEGLLIMLPKENRQRIESDKGREEYVETVENYEYKFSCGHKMGTPDHPVYRNLPTDYNYHGGPPELVSPIVSEVEQVDYQKLMKIIMSEMEDIGITWKRDPKGNVEKRVDPKPTPEFLGTQRTDAEADPEKVEVEDEDDDE